MCGRYVVVTPPGQLALEFDAALDPATLPPDRAPDYNVAPTKLVPAVLLREGTRTLTSLRWGLVPFWAKDASIGSRMINARIESVAQKPAFRQALARRRCLLPANGYYEWRKPQSAQTKTPKQPYFIHSVDGATLAFAGLYERWRDSNGAELRTVSILTGAAPSALAWIHDRMPLTVPEAVWAAWLDPEPLATEEIRGLVELDPAWTARPVGDLVNSVTHNGPELVEAIERTEPGPGMSRPDQLF